MVMHTLIIIVEPFLKIQLPYKDNFYGCNRGQPLWATFVLMHDSAMYEIMQKLLIQNIYY